MATLAPTKGPGENRCMRVIGGQWGGQRLDAPRGSDTRPTSDRTREALFSILHDVSGWQVLDLFAGTGAVGIEALSRGAARAVFVERDRNAAEALRRNLDRVGAAEAELLLQPVAKALMRVGESFDLVFADPPYDRAESLMQPVFQRAGTLLAESGILVAEQRSRDQALSGGADLIAFDTRRYGEATLVFFRKQ